MTDTPVIELSTVNARDKVSMSPLRLIKATVIEPVPEPINPNKVEPVRAPVNLPILTPISDDPVARPGNVIGSSLSVTNPASKAVSLTTNF